MALMVGELLAKINADDSGYNKTTDKVVKRHEQVTKKISDTKPEIDADTGPIDKKTKDTEQKSRESAKAIDKAFASAWQSVAKDLQRIEREAWESGDGVSDAFTSSMDKAKAELQTLRAAAAKSGAGLSSELGEALRKVQAEIKELGPASREAGEEVAENLGGGLSEGLSEVLSGVGGGGPVGELVESFMSGKGAIIGVGLTLGGLLVSALQQRWAELKVGALIAAQTGAAASEIGRLGALAGDLYARGFGESIEEAGEAIASVVNVLIPADATDEAIGRIASKVQTLGTVMGEEFGNISRAARTMLFNGLADNVSQALDLIAEANEAGLNIAGDLLDTLSEYSSQFARLGLDGKEALGLLQQAMEGGARDTDFAADALKEFVLRSQDLSVSARGFEALGFNAETMSRRIAAGGDTARDALREVLNGLQTMEPGLERNTAAVDLFGTKAEDLADSLYYMDLDNAAQKFDNFGGSVEEMAQKLDEGRTLWDDVGRGISNLGAKIGEGIENIRGEGGIEGLTDQFKLLKVAQEEALATGSTSALDELGEKYQWLKPLIDDWIAANGDAVESQGELTGASNATTGSYEEQRRTLGELIEMEQDRAGKVLDLSEAQIGYQEAIDAANQSIKDNGKNLDITTEAGQKNRSTLNDLADQTWKLVESMEASNATTDEVRRFMGTAREQFIRTATSMGMSSGEAKRLADQLGLIPGNYKASVQLTGVELAKQRAQSLINLINSIPPEKLITMRINTTGMPGGHFFADQATGSIAEFYAAGGLRPMQGHAAGVVQSYSRTGVMRVIGDNARHDEAYIPLDPSNARSQAILDEALRRMRPEWFTRQQSDAGVAASTVAAPAGRAGHSFVINGPDPRAVAREVVEILDAREALRG